MRKNCCQKDKELLSDIENCQRENCCQKEKDLLSEGERIVRNGFVAREILLSERELM